MAEFSIKTIIDIDGNDFDRISNANYNLLEKQTPSLNIKTSVTDPTLTGSDYDTLHSSNVEFFKFDCETDEHPQLTKRKITSNKSIDTSGIGYWQTVHSIESKQGKLLFRPRNKSRNCDWTTAPCGHHQLTARALTDIGCKSLQCRKDRLNYRKSLAMSKRLLALNEKRLSKNGYNNLKGYQKYLIHQQGATGIKIILAAQQGKGLLSNSIKKNIANNSPLPYQSLKKWGSKDIANMFLDHWKYKWDREKELIAKSHSTKNIALNTPTNSYQIDVPKFDMSELTLALNYTF